jgi:hypothetical protein
VNSETSIQTSAPESTEMPPTPETQEPATAAVPERNCDAGTAPGQAVGSPPNTNTRRSTRVRHPPQRFEEQTCFFFVSPSCRYDCL